MARNKLAGTHENRRLALTRRVVHLIQLFQAGEKLYKKELAEAFGVDVKTLGRYVTALSEFFPIRKIKDGRQVYYVLEEKDGRKKVRKMQR